MFVHTHPAIVSNCLLLGTEIFFLALLAIGIYNHNPGPRAFGIMYREVRVILLSWSHAPKSNYLFTSGPAVACSCNTGGDCSGCKQGIFVTSYLGAQLPLGFPYLEPEW